MQSYQKHLNGPVNFALCLSESLHVWQNPMFVRPSVCLSVSDLCPSVCLSVCDLCLSIHMSVCLSGSDLCLSVCLSDSDLCPSVCLLVIYVPLSVPLSVCVLVIHVPLSVCIHLFLACFICLCILFQLPSDLSVLLLCICVTLWVYLSIISPVCQSVFGFWPFFWYFKLPLFFHLSTSLSLICFGYLFYVWCRLSSRMQERKKWVSNDLTTSVV